MSRQTRPNVFLNVDVKEPELPQEEEVLDMKPPEELPKPTEKEIFRKPELKLEKPVVKRKADRITDAKRTVTPKMRAHLDRIRIKASEAKKKKACEKAGVPYDPPPEAEPMPSPLAPQPVAQAPSMPTIQESVRSIAPHPQQVAPNVAPNVAPSIDYDRIVNGLWSRQQKYNEEQKYMAEMREQIRKEEREKAMKESTGLLQQAAVKYKKAHQAQLGNNVLSNYQNRYQGHPVFKLKNNNGKFETSSGGAANPFDVCFK